MTTTSSRRAAAAALLALVVCCATPRAAVGYMQEINAPANNAPPENIFGTQQPQPTEVGGGKGAAAAVAVQGDVNGVAAAYDAQTGNVRIGAPAPIDLEAGGLYKSPASSVTHSAA
jgi:hypothetical protein